MDTRRSLKTGRVRIVLGPGYILRAFMWVWQVNEQKVSDEDGAAAHRRCGCYHFAELAKA